MRIGCPVQIEVVYNRIIEKLVIKKVCTEHNHEVDEEIYKTLYPKVRLEPLKNQNLQDYVELEPQSKKFKFFVEKKFNTYLSQKDSANLKAKYRNGKKCEITDNLNRIAENFSGQNGNIFDVCVNESDELTFIYIQTKEGVDLFDRMPSVLMIDGTYKINSLGMPLYVFMGSDSLNSGRIIAACLIVSETQDIIDNILAKFKEFNPKANEVELIVADKDLSQKASLEKAFPCAIVHLCLFHIEQAWLRKISKFGLEKSDEELANKMFRQMAFAQTEIEYAEIEERFSKTFKKEVVDYFDENWAKIADSWAGYSFKNLICYGETTNNKLESKNGAIKTLINSTDNLDRCIEKLIRFIQDDHANSRYKVNYIRLTTAKSSVTDSKLIVMMKLASTPTAVGIVKKNEKLANAKGITAEMVDENTYTV